MEVESAMRRLMLASETVNGYVIGAAYRHRLEAPLVAGGRAVVLRRNGGWTAPDTIQTGEFPLVQVRCYADPTRDDDGNVSRGDALDKAWALYRAIDPLLHGKRGVRWGAVGSNPGLLVISSARHSEPFEITDKDVHGSSALSLTADPLGDMVMVLAQYALHVVH